ncbi:MAG TPA: hypothetical protein PLU33_04995 [Treponemataceae bacterium]|nr:hypothetical protein [Treponemataceae bacterium]
MKKTRHGVFFIIFVLFLTSCSEFIPFQDLNTLNEQYTTSASIDSHQLTSFSAADKSGTVCIPSQVPATVRFSIINLYPHVLTMTPATSSVCTAGPVMSHVGDDLSLAELAFTLDSSEELKTVDFTISVQSADGLRSFGTYNVSYFCNSMPSEASLLGKAFSPELNSCVFYGVLPSGPADIDITDAEITYYKAGTTTLSGTVTINPFEETYNQRPAGLPESFIHSALSFYYYIKDSAEDYDWGITLIDSAGLRSAAVYTTPLLLSVLPAVTASEETGTYYIDDPASGFAVDFTSSSEDSKIEYRTKMAGDEYGNWVSADDSVYAHNFPVGVTSIQLRAYKQLYPYSPVAEFTYTVIPNNIVGFTIPDIADTDLEITISAQNPADDSLITATNGSYEIPSSDDGIRITASVSPVGTYTYTWTLFNSDGTVNPAAPVVTDNAAVYTGLPSGFYSLIVIAEDADGNAGMEFIPLYTSY